VGEESSTQWLIAQQLAMASMRNKLEDYQNNDIASRVVKLMR
jgi:hypothetical protein